MSLCRYEKTVVPVVPSEAALWHVAHGWVYNVFDRRSRPLGTVYVTLLCGAGGILHFETISKNIPPAVILSAMRKAVRMFGDIFDVLYATIPARLSGLISCCVRLGFGIVEEGGFVSDNEEITLLKFYRRRKSIL